MLTSYVILRDCCQAQNIILIISIVIVIIGVGEGGMHAAVRVWRSEVNFVALGLCISLHVGPRH